MSKEPMTLDRALEAMVKSYCATKRELCRGKGGPVDLFVQMHVVRDDGTQGIGIVESRELIPECYEKLRVREFGGLHVRQPVRYVGVLADTLYRPAGPDDDPDTMRGQLTQEREEGRMDARDALSVVVYAVHDDETRSRILPYHYDDRGMPRFEVPIEHDALGGAIVDILREHCRA